MLLQAGRIGPAVPDKDARVEIPEGTTVKVVENTADTSHIVLPLATDNAGRNFHRGSGEGRGGGPHTCTTDCIEAIHPGHQEPEDLVGVPVDRGEEYQRR